MSPRGTEALSEHVGMMPAHWAQEGVRRLIKVMHGLCRFARTQLHLSLWKNLLPLAPGQLPPHVLLAGIVSPVSLMVCNNIVSLTHLRCMHFLNLQGFMLVQAVPAISPGCFGLVVN